jgi:hypothetical protein
MIRSDRLVGSELFNNQTGDRAVAIVDLRAAFASHPAAPAGGASE